MLINQDNRIDEVLRGSSIGSFNLDQVSISVGVLNAVPITISGTYQQTEIQKLADAISEIRKPLV